MYVIVVYDVNVARINTIRKFLRQYLHWVQNSVFEGELTPAELEKIIFEIQKIIKDDEDSVRIYALRSDKLIKTIELGKSNVDLDSII